MQDFEKLGVFYLGKTFDLATGQVQADQPVLYDAKDLTTHAVVLGMTGSGKTGLCVDLLEEAAIDGIPALVIDPKGDIGNLLLTFPKLAASDFRPWIDESEATRKGLSPDDFATQTALNWKSGLAQWGQDGARVQRLRDAVDMAIYTPGNTSGRPLQILRSFSAPPQAILDDASALRDRILSAVSGLLGLMGLSADPIQSREHILLSNILDRAWREGRSLDIAGLIMEIQKPPFERIGVFDLEAFYPAKERFGLAMALNNLIASPGFSAWMEGEPLDIQRLLFTADGRPRVSVLSIAHLSDAERMFFVTILLNEVVAWMRAQSGTSSLRALLYMDEIFGYFPPTGNPPSKTPMLTLLKQARAFGLGCVLSTQNPVDLDYKGLANAGTWMIGRLQTERDKMRVIEGLEGVLASAGRNLRPRPHGGHAGRVGQSGLPDAQCARGPAGGVPEPLGLVLPARSHDAAADSTGHAGPARGAGRRARDRAGRCHHPAARRGAGGRPDASARAGSHRPAGAAAGDPRVFPAPRESRLRRGVSPGHSGRQQVALCGRQGRGGHLADLQPAGAAGR
jgi:hypothetical protein